VLTGLKTTNELLVLRNNVYARWIAKK